MRFARRAGQIIAFTTIHVYKGGRGKRRRIRLFDHEGPIKDLAPADFKRAVHKGRIKRLDLPDELREDAEELSDLIGEEYTPQEALRILQSMIQDAPKGEVVHHA